MRYSNVICQFVSFTSLGIYSTAKYRGVTALLAQTRQSLVSLPLSALVPEPRSGVRRKAAAWPGCGVVCVVRFCGSLVSPFAGVEAGARLASRACGLWVPLLAASGGGLVAVVATTFPHDVSKCSSVALAGTIVIVWPCLVFCGLLWSGRRQTHASGGSRLVSSRYRSSILGCQFVVALACMASRPCGVPGVRGGSACGPSTLYAEHSFRLVPDSVGFCGSRFPIFGVPSALAGEGLIV
ncbi:hypothetical protein Taro_033510 [Colocasia esculenta]|uniref:Uncharacterized protein n=1 Tax=Colocasia esculenta TaxID=4460 RepID=A0A843VVG7_COLES|nr:hypothetical protein [Colocasia esculenta]